MAARNSTPDRVTFKHEAVLPLVIEADVEPVVRGPQYRADGSYADPDEGGRVEILRVYVAMDDGRRIEIPRAVLDDYDHEWLAECALAAQRDEDATLVRRQQLVTTLRDIADPTHLVRSLGGGRP